jgi:hypothetical protein
MRAIVIVVASLTCAPVAHASHAQVESVMSDVVGRLTPQERSLTTGVYVAFDESRVDVLAQAACDDDGDYVVVVSEAMLDLIERVAVASSQNILTEYQSRLSQQPAQAPLLPLPAGAYDAPADPAVRDRTWTSAVRYVLGAELSHETSERLVCPRPTPTRERADDVWTDGERSAALRSATFYSAATIERADQRSLEWMFDAGAPEDGAVDVLGTLGALEPRGLGGYVRLHPHALLRKANLVSWAADWRSKGIRGAPLSL